MPADLLSKLPSEPFGLFDSDADREKADKYAAELVASGTIRADQAEEMAQGLQRTAEFYRYGKVIEGRLAEYHLEPKEIRPSLKKRKRGMPERYRMRGLIWVMAIIWEHFGNHAGTAEDPILNNVSPFQRFVAGWLALIDPRQRQVPSRQAFRAAIKKLREQGPN